MDPIVTLTTDFGDRTGYVGMMHGAIYRYYPDARVIDLTHAINPGRVREAAFVLGQAYRHFPPGSVHVAVVDPGVGTARRAIALDVGAVGRFVGPDNGLFAYVLAAHPETVAREIVNPAFMAGTVTHTFHGRDIFAPAGARLAAGAPFGEVGPLVPLMELRSLPDLSPDWVVEEEGRRVLRGQVMHVDRFGNLISNLARSRFESLEPAARALLRVSAVGITATGVARTYGEHRTGEIIALFGSGGFLEVARVGGRVVATEDDLLLDALVTVVVPME